MVHNIVSGHLSRLKNQEKKFSKALLILTMETAVFLPELMGPRNEMCIHTLLSSLLSLAHSPGTSNCDKATLYTAIHIRCYERGVIKNNFFGAPVCSKHK